MIFLVGQVIHGRRTLPLLLSLPQSERQDLECNLKSNGCVNGRLTERPSSIEHYLSAAVELRLLSRQGSIFSPTSRAQFLADAVRPNWKQPYPLSDPATVFFLNLILKSDYCGFLALARALSEGTPSLTELQRGHQTQLFGIFDEVKRSRGESRLQRAARDREMAIRNWKKPVSYSEHLVSAKLNWMLDLGIARLMESRRDAFAIADVHREWVRECIATVPPTDADIASFTHKFAISKVSGVAISDTAGVCPPLESAFLSLARTGVLQKIRGEDMVLFLLCFHSLELQQWMLAGLRLFSESSIKCGLISYKLNSASRPTQSFVVRSVIGEK